MKKHITTNVDQNTVDFRRSTRNTTVNKLSKSRKGPKVVNDDVISSNARDFRSRDFYRDIASRS